MTGKQLVKILKEKGYYLDRVSGSHHVLKKDAKTVVVPVHGSKDLGKGLLTKISKQIGINL